MSIRTTLCATLAAAGFFYANAQGLDGKTIVLEANDQMSIDVPVSLPFEGTIADGEVIRIIEPKTGKEFPATLRDGQLTFVPEGAKPKSEHLYTVKVRQDNVPPRVQITKNEAGDALEVLIDDVPFTTYHYNKEQRKPYLWPVLSDGTVGITRDYPMGEGLMTEDHPHQKSFWSSYGDVNGADCWDERNEKAGYEVSDEVTYGSGDGYGWIHAKNTWQSADKKPVCKEEREYRFYPGDKTARLVDLQVTFNTIDGDVKFGDTKEGGIAAFRVNDQIIERETYSVVDKSGAVLKMFDDKKEADAFVQEDASRKLVVRPKGVITNAEGKTGMAECWGKPSPWCDYSGTIDGQGVHGVTVFDNPSNLRYPTTWHVRDYGLMGANCFGLSYFTNKEQNGDYIIKSGESLTFNYRVYVHRGDSKAAKVADRYADYINPPKVSWSDIKINAKGVDAHKDIPGHERDKK